MIYSHFYRHNSFCTVFWVSSFYLSVNIVLYQFTVTCIENWSVRSLGQWIIESKVYLLSMLERKKKVQDCDYVFGSSTKFQRGMTGFVKEDICRQISVCWRVFCGISFVLKPVRDYSLCSVCVLLSVCSLHFTLSLPFTPGPQSAFYTDRQKPRHAGCSPRSLSAILFPLFPREAREFNTCVF